MANRTSERSYAVSFRPPDRGKYGLMRVAPPKRHLTAYMTGGLKHLYDRIKNKTAPQKQHEHGYFTNSNGVLTIRQNMPLLASRYRVVAALGKGQSSVLIKAEDLFHGGELVAVKVLHKHYQMLGAQETDCVRRLNIADPDAVAPTLRLRTVFQFDDHYCMVFEMLSPGPLTELFVKWNRTEALVGIRRVARYVLTALGFLQQHEVIHADLKPENILLKKVGDLRSLKVVDFGNAIHCIHEELSLYYDDFELQTLLYRAPEVMFGLSFGVEIDLWSLGCVLAELYLGKPLFSGRDKNDVMRKMVDVLGPIPEEMCRHGKFFKQMSQFTAKHTPPRSVVDMMNRLGCFDYAFIDFLVRLLKYRPSERMTVTEAACHPFLASEGGAAFFLPTNCNNNGSVGYPMLLLDRANYNKKPVISEEIHRRRMGSTELLHCGTSSNSQQAFETCTFKWPFFGRSFKPKLLAIVKPAVYSPSSHLTLSPTVVQPLSIAQRTMKELAPHAINGRHSASAISLPSGGHIESYKTSRGPDYSALSQQGNATKFHRTLSHPAYSQSSSSSNHIAASHQYNINKPNAVVPPRPFLASTSGPLTGAKIGTASREMSLQHTPALGQMPATPYAHLAATNNNKYSHSQSLARGIPSHVANVACSTLPDPQLSTSNPSSPQLSYSPRLLQQTITRMNNAERHQQFSSIMQQMRQRQEAVEDLSVKKIKIEPTSPVHSVGQRRNDLDSSSVERHSTSSQTSVAQSASKKSVNSNHKLDPSRLRLPLSFVASPDQNKDSRSLYLNCTAAYNVYRDSAHAPSGSASAPILSAQPPSGGKPLNYVPHVYIEAKARGTLSSHIQSPLAGSPTSSHPTPTRSPVSVGTPSSDRSTPENNGDQQKSRPLKKRIRTNLYEVVFSKSEDAAPHEGASDHKPRINGCSSVLNTTYTCLTPTLCHDKSRKQPASEHSSPYSSPVEPSPIQQVTPSKPTHDDNDNKIVYTSSSSEEEEGEHPQPHDGADSPKSRQNDCRSSPLMGACSPSNEGSSPLDHYQHSDNSKTDKEVKGGSFIADSGSHSDTSSEDTDSDAAKSDITTSQHHKPQRPSAKAKCDVKSDISKSRPNGALKAAKPRRTPKQLARTLSPSEKPRKRQHIKTSTPVDKEENMNGATASKKKKTAPRQKALSDERSRNKNQMPKSQKTARNKTPTGKDRSSEADGVGKLWRSPRNVPKQSYYFGDSSDDEVYTISEHIWYNEEPDDSKATPAKTSNGIHRNSVKTPRTAQMKKKAPSRVPQIQANPVTPKVEKTPARAENTPLRARRLPQRVAVTAPQVESTPSMARHNAAEIPSSRKRPPTRVRVVPPTPDSSPSKRARLQRTPRRSAKTSAVIIDSDSPDADNSFKSKQVKSGRLRERHDSLTEADQYIEGCAHSDSSCSTEEPGEVLTLPL